MHVIDFPLIYIYKIVSIYANSDYAGLSRNASPAQMEGYLYK
jgi:hypothetical protein